MCRATGRLRRRPDDDRGGEGRRRRRSALASWRTRAVVCSRSVAGPLPGMAELTPLPAHCRPLPQPTIPPDPESTVPPYTLVFQCAIHLSHSPQACEHGSGTDAQADRCIMEPRDSMQELAHLERRSAIPAQNLLFFRTHPENVTSRLKKTSRPARTQYDTDVE